MDYEWVAIKQLDDLADAEWEAAALREADIPARVDESGGGISILVESQQAEAAREILHALEGEEEEEPTAPAEDPDEPEAPSRLVSNSPERDRRFRKAFVLAILGVAIPPLLVVSANHLWKGWHRPEPLAAEDLHQLLFAGLLVLGGLVGWISLAVQATKLL
jgi:hypothetical protein